MTEMEFEIAEAITRPGALLLAALLLLGSIFVADIINILLDDLANWWRDR